MGAGDAIRLNRLMARVLLDPANWLYVSKYLSSFNSIRSDCNLNPSPNTLMVRGPACDPRRGTETNLATRNQSSRVLLLQSTFSRSSIARLCSLLLALVLACLTCPHCPRRCGSDPERVAGHQCCQDHGLWTQRGLFFSYLSCVAGKTALLSRRRTGFGHEQLHNPGRGSAV